MKGSLEVTPQNQPQKVVLVVLEVFLVVLEVVLLLLVVVEGKFLFAPGRRSL